MQIQCPGCKTKLQLPDETKPGTRVQCPSCKKVLALPGTPNPSAAGGAPPKQQPSPPKPAPAPAPPPASFEDEEEGGLYGVRNDPDLDDEEEEVAPKKGKSKGPSTPPKKKKPVISYAPDTSIKDLRGPAMTHVVQPSNYMMLQCGLVMVTAIASIAIAVWPFMFQERVLIPTVALKPYYAEKMATPGQEGKNAKSRWDRVDGGWVEWPRPKKAKEDDTGFSRGEEMKDYEYEAAMIEVNKHYPFAVAWLVLSILILAYALTVAFGAVKMQSLESYAWAMTSAVLAMIPFGAMGLLVYFFKPGMDFQADMPIILFVLAIEAVFTLLVGLMNLAVLLKEEVKAGFAYRSDAVG
jgi:hypothetical protein